MHRNIAVLAAGFGFFLFAPCLLAQEKPVYVWLEAEHPTSANFEVKADGRKAELMSGGKSLWVDLPPAQAPAEGLLLKYEFSAPQAGKYELWARLGMEWVRSPVDWKIDGGEWRTYSSQELTTNLVEISTWNEMAWGKWGAVELAAGHHTLQIRCQKPGSSKKLVLALDCLALVKSEGRFVPEMGLKPGETYQGKVDLDAAAQVYRFKEGAIKPGGERLELPLDGLWQVARYDDPDMNKDPYEQVRALPEASYPLRWMGIEGPKDAWKEGSQAAISDFMLNGPGDAWSRRPELFQAHRILYQTRFNVPAELAGRSFVLHFSGTNWIASVFVNGEYAGGRQSVLVPWEVDLSKFVRPGQDNVLTVAIKGPYYAFETKVPKQEPLSLNNLRNTPRTGQFMRYHKYVDAIFPSTKGEGDGLLIGLVNPVKLVVTGPAYTSDVFIRPSVAKKRLEADVEITNPGAQAMDLEVQCAAVNDKTGQVEKTFAPVAVSVPGGERKIVPAGGEWAQAKLWWPSESVTDLPDCYQLRTTILAGGQPVDVRNDLFGFREITIQGKDFVLNGIPWHFYNWVDVAGAQSDEDWFQKYHAQNDRFHRLDSNVSHRFGYRKKAVEWLDRHGISARCSTCIDGMFITHDPTNLLVWKNFENHLRQVVQAYRNHPAIVHWSILNEFLLTVRLYTGRGADYERFEQDEYKLGQAVAELDPTRPWYADGDGDLGGLAPVNCQHYYWNLYSDVPRELYAYRIGPAVKPRPEKDLIAKSGDLYLWDGKRPLVGGEEFYAMGATDKMAWIGGPEVFRSKQFVNLATAKYARMAIEGARWQGVGGIGQFLFPPTSEALRATAPRAVFVREYNACFYPGSTLTRKIAVFNEGRTPEELTLKWKLLLGGQPAGQGEKTYQVAPGTHQEDTLQASLPKASNRVDGELQLELYDHGQKVFEDAKPVCLLPVPTGATALDAKTLGVFDPGGTLEKWLSARPQAFTKLDNLEAIPEGCRVVLVGPNALTEAGNKKAGPALRNFVLAGNTAIVLEQNTPLQKNDLPVAGVATFNEQKKKPSMMEFIRQEWKSGAICHPTAPAHPVLAGLKPADFFTWAGPTEVNFRLSYATPASGSVNLIQAGTDLALTPMMELPVGAGSYLLSQMTIGEKLGVEPTADRLLGNMLNWAAQRKNAKPGKTTLYAGNDPALGEFMASLGVDLAPVQTPAEALAGDSRVAVLRASAETLKWLKEHAAEVKSFCSAGGWIMLVGLDQSGMEDFSAVVGVPHRWRPMRCEKVTLDNRQDALLLGLSDREFTQYGPEMIAPWIGLHRVSNQVFSGVIDAGAEIGSFAQCPYPRLFDGLTQDDIFWYTDSFNADGSQPVEMKFDRPQKVAGLSIQLSDSYYLIKDVELSYDGKDAQKFTLKETTEPQELPVTPHEAAQVTLKVLSHYPGAVKKELVTISEMVLTRSLPDDWSTKVVPLTQPGGIVKYPLGSGGIVLNQIQWVEPVYSAEEVKKNRNWVNADKIAEENLAKKKSIFSSLLRNMGAGFKAVTMAPAKSDPKK